MVDRESAILYNQCYTLMSNFIKTSLSVVIDNNRGTPQKKTEENDVISIENFP